MSWQAHIKTGEKALLGEVRKKPRQSRKVLASSLIVSKLMYLIPIWGGTTRNYMTKLQVTLNNTARFVTGIVKELRQRH